MKKKPPNPGPLSKRRLRQIAKRGKPNQREARLLAAMASDLLALRSIPPPDAPVRLFELTLTEEDEMPQHRFSEPRKRLRLECREVMASIQRGAPGPRLRVEGHIEDACRMLPEYGELRARVVEGLGAGIGKKLALSLPVTKPWSGLPMPSLGSADFNPFKGS